MSTFERMNEFGTLRALGFKPTHIIQIILTETLCIAIVASTAALMIGGYFSYYFSQHGIYIAKIAETMSGVSQYIYTHFTWTDLVYQFGIGCGIAIIGTLYPIYQFNRKPVVDTLKAR